MNTIKIAALALILAACSSKEPNLDAIDVISSGGAAPVAPTPAPHLVHIDLVKLVPDGDSVKAAFKVTDPAPRGVTELCVRLLDADGAELAHSSSEDFAVKGHQVVTVDIVATQAKFAAAKKVTVYAAKYGCVSPESDTVSDVLALASN